MRFIVRFFWFFSAAGFLFSLFYAYGHVQERIFLPVLDHQLAITRSEFFYGCLAFFIAISCGTAMLGQLIGQIPDSAFFVPNKKFWTSDSIHRKSANHILQNGLWVLGSVVNSFLIFWMMYMVSEFHFEGLHNPNLHYFQWPGLVMAFSLLFPWLRLFVKNTNFLPQRDRI